MRYPGCKRPCMAWKCHCHYKSDCQTFCNTFKMLICTSITTVDRSSGCRSQSLRGVRINAPPILQPSIPTPTFVHITPVLVHSTMEPAAEPLIPEAIPPSQTPHEPPAISGKLPWIPLAALSGACAAFNGVFAKLYLLPTCQLRSFRY